MSILDLSPSAVVNGIKAQLATNFDTLIEKLDEVIDLLREHNDLHVEQDGL